MEVVDKTIDKTSEQIDKIFQGRGLEEIVDEIYLQTEYENKGDPEVLEAIDELTNIQTKAQLKAILSLRKDNLYDYLCLKAIKRMGEQSGTPVDELLYSTDYFSDCLDYSIKLTHEDFEEAKEFALYLQSFIIYKNAWDSLLNWSRPKQEKIKGN